MHSRLDRRRRIQYDDSVESGEQSLQSPATPHGRETYIRQAIEFEQPRVLDLFPTRPWSILLAYVLGFGCLMGLLAISYHYASEKETAAPGFAKLVDPREATSLLHWLSATLWLVLAAGCFTIFSLRKHRIDDYRGHYRVWAVALFACLLCSSNAISHWSQSLPALANSWISDSGPTFASILGVVLIGGFLLRMAIEVRRSFLALTAVALGTLSILVTQNELSRGMVGAVGQSHPALTSLGGTLLGQWFFLLATSLYARHVLLDAMGLVAIKPGKSSRKSRSKKAAEASASSDGDSRSSVERPKLKTDLSPSPAAKQAETHSRAVEADEEDEQDDSDSEQFSGLSRAERKRLKRQMRQSHRKGAA